jgi:hypothetical protein
VKKLDNNFIPCMQPACMCNPNTINVPLPPIIPRRLAEAYVPDQPYIGLLPLDVALTKGTIFPNMLASFPEISKK